MTRQTDLFANCDSMLVLEYLHQLVNGQFILGLANLLSPVITRPDAETLEPRKTRRRCQEMSCSGFSLTANFQDAANTAPKRLSKFPISFQLQQSEHHE